MRIAILVAGLPPLCNGGTEIATVALAKCASMKHEVHVIAATSEDGEYKIPSVTVHTVRSVRVSYLYGLFYVPGAVQTIIKIKPDVIHAQGTQMALAAFVASKITGIPYIFYGRGEIYTKWFGKRFLSSILMNEADRIIAQTVDMAEEMGLYTFREIEVIPNGIDVERFQFQGIAKSTYLKVAIAIGRARPEKNLTCFVDAMKYLHNELGFDHAMGVIIGDGEQIPMLKKRAEGVNIKFIGALDNSEIPACLKSADVLVNTSLSEGFPMAVLEAYAAGLPVVVPDVTGMREIVSHKVNGIVVEPDNYKATALAIQKVFTDSKMAAYFSKNNTERVKLYTWDKVVEKLYK
jgi:glycosyltransferase involved in cell wall biosynthesis